MTGLTAPLGRDWETTFQSWAAPPSAAQDEKCARAVNAIKNAIAKNTKLSSLGVTVHVQGSYRNRTAVRFESDVDTCVLFSGTQIAEYPAGVTDTLTGLSPASYQYAQYRSDVGVALVSHFGAANVKRGNKAFDINENTYRVDADAVACFEYRKYFRDPYGTLRYHVGTGLYPDNSTRAMSNFPEQQYANGVAKHTATTKRFKKVVRIVKRLRNEMEERGAKVAAPISSYLIESLVWNVPDYVFSGPTLHDVVRSVLLQIWMATGATTLCPWQEENGIKPLFSVEQKWTQLQVNSFALSAWSYTK